MPDARIRALVVDDEPLGRKRLEGALAAHPDVEVVGTAADGAAAVDAIRRLKPSLVFLDVQMPRMTGLDVARALGSEMPLTIFVTAYDKHAVDAFELAATDYLVKPFDDDRFDQALDRARRHLRNETAARIQERLMTVLSELPVADGEAGAAAAAAPSSPPVADASSPPAAGLAAPPAAGLASPPAAGQPSRSAPQAPATAPTPSPRYLERIPVESRGEIRFIPTADIQAIVASGPYVEIVTATQRPLVRETMNALEEQLDPRRFIRIHRSTIVALDEVETLLRGAGGDYEVKMKNGARLAVARSRRGDLEERLGLGR